MKNFHPFFSIGTIGMVAAACLHIFLAWGLSLTDVHTSFMILYPLFTGFLMMGVALTVKAQKETK